MISTTHRKVSSGVGPPTQPDPSFFDDLSSMTDGQSYLARAIPIGSAGGAQGRASLYTYTSVPDGLRRQNAGDDAANQLFAEPGREWNNSSGRMKWTARLSSATDRTGGGAIGYAATNRVESSSPYIRIHYVRSSTGNSTLVFRVHDTLGHMEFYSATLDPVTQTRTIEGEWWIKDASTIVAAFKLDGALVLPQTAFAYDTTRLTWNGVYIRCNQTALVEDCRFRNGSIEYGQNLQLIT